MAKGDGALVLRDATAIARTGTLVQWSKYEVLVGEYTQFRDAGFGSVKFPDRGKNGVSILAADRAFRVYRDFAEFKVGDGKAFITTEDVRDIGLEGTGPLALKISLDKDAVKLPPVPLHHVIGMEIAGADGRTVRIADFSGFGVPLRITNYDLPSGGPGEALALTMAEHLGKPTSNVYGEETLRLETSGNPRILFAYGQSVCIDEHDLSKGLMAVITPETEVVLRISRRPHVEDGAFYPSNGILVVLEDLEQTRPLSPRSGPS
ncbi:MAG: hypothetical protein V1827_00025 [Candidatus Micrarchaeota archaeon]